MSKSIDNESVHLDFDKKYVYLLFHIFGLQLSMQAYKIVLI